MLHGKSRGGGGKEKGRSENFRVSGPGDSENAQTYRHEILTEVWTILHAGDGMEKFTPAKTSETEEEGRSGSGGSG